MGGLKTLTAKLAPIKERYNVIIINPQKLTETNAIRVDILSGSLGPFINDDNNKEGAILIDTNSVWYKEEYFTHFISCY